VTTSHVISVPRGPWGRLCGLTAAHSRRLAAYCVRCALVRLNAIQTTILMIHRIHRRLARLADVRYVQYILHTQFLLYRKSRRRPASKLRSQQPPRATMPRRMLVNTGAGRALGDDGLVNRPNPSAPRRPVFIPLLSSHVWSYRSEIQSLHHAFKADPSPLWLATKSNPSPPPTRTLEDPRSGARRNPQLCSALPQITLSTTLPKKPTLCSPFSRNPAVGP
jgi:hypothetical protein